MALQDFLGFLSKEGMIDIGSLKTDSEYGLETRLKVYRYVYLAIQRYNLELNYPYTIFLFGPLSRELRKECYDLNTDNMPSEPNMPAFKKEEFLSALKDKSPGWLEVAGMIIFHTNENKSMPKRDYLYWLISEYPPKFIDEVYADMRNLKIG